MVKSLDIAEERLWSIKAKLEREPTVCKTCRFAKRKWWGKAVCRHPVIGNLRLTGHKLHYANDSYSRRLNYIFDCRGGAKGWTPRIEEIG